MPERAQGEVQPVTESLLTELRRVARHYMSRERPNHTLQPTALVNEAFIRLREQNVAFENRQQFIGFAARLMRQVLVDHAREKQAAKRGRGEQPLALDVNTLDPRHDETRTVDVLSLHEGLERLSELNGRLAEVVELRYFGGLSLAEVAETLGVSEATVSNDWKTARAWLRRQLLKR